MKTAILFGATGHVGSYLLTLLLNDPAYNRVTIVVRKTTNIHHPKLTVLQGDFYPLAQLRSALIANEVFITLGSSDPQMEKDYPILAAALCYRQANIHRKRITYTNGRK